MKLYTVMTQGCAETKIILIQKKIKGDNLREIFNNAGRGILCYMTHSSVKAHH